MTNKSLVRNEYRTCIKCTNKSKVNKGTCLLGMKMDTCIPLRQTHVCLSEIMRLLGNIYFYIYFVASVKFEYSHSNAVYFSLYLF